MTHRFLSPAAAEAFAGTTPEQVRADLAHMDEAGRWPDGERPGWARQLDEHRWSDHRYANFMIANYGLQYLADQAAAATAPKPRPLCRCGHTDDDHLWPTCWGCNRREEGQSIACDAGEGDEFCDCDRFVPVEEG